MLSKKTKYALHALSFLKKEIDNGPVLISDIAKSANIPKKFLESILLDLKKLGFLKSKMGKGGGYFLHKQPHEISLAVIIRFFNGPIALLPCASKNYYEPCEECPNQDECRLHHVMISVRNDTLKVLEQRTVADL